MFIVFIFVLQRPLNIAPGLCFGGFAGISSFHGFIQFVYGFRVCLCVCVCVHLCARVCSLFGKQRFACLMCVGPGGHRPCRRGTWAVVVNEPYRW